ncbi:hypothetical protein ERX46_16375 [Brumimicrobium glaciale]|uniref:Type II toxin-antitoxin system PemK/MazF family toxin n=1 Tax=Brumimicrobium glaciale TaxID=200475 RepID=A0A4Q4KEI2_9FLAO|nr:type II toxin-antitoxin system PemK/MazF family toxin [Brumimicrobium glaciale]RYM31482.1 hypothetical protein ERX46_16375 [Brumimicrobium glaciale]
MAYNRGEIVEFYLELPYQASAKPHPFIIISNDGVFEQDGMYICVMITHSKHIDQFTFEIEDEMLIKGGDGKFSQVRCHLIVNIKEEEIIVTRQRNKLKNNYVDRLVSRIEYDALS